MGAGRPPNPLQKPAIAELIKHLKVGADLDLVRPKFSIVPVQTWRRWVAIAKEHFTAQGGPVPPPTPRPPPPKRAASQANTKPPRAPATATTPKDDSRHGKPTTKRHGDTVGFSDDGDTYIVQTMFGPKEHPILDRWVDPPDLDPHDALAILDRLGEQYLNARALMLSARKRVGDGHVILDPVAYANGVKLQVDASTAMHKALKDSRNLDSVRRFLTHLMTALTDEDPDFAERVVTLLREASSHYLQAQQRCLPQ